MTEFTIPFELTDLNTYINAERTNPYKAADVKKKQTGQVCLFAKALKLKPETQYDLEIIWTTPNKMKDSDNVFFAVKFILDGVKNAGKIKDDSYKYIRNINNIRVIDRTNTGVLVKFIEVQDV